MADAAPWERLSPRARRAILVTSFAPPLVLIFVFTPLYLRYVGDPTDLNLALLVAASVGLFAVGIGLILRLLLILRHEPAPPRRPRIGGRQMAKIGVALLGFMVVYLLAIYAVVFGLWPLHESSGSGAIAVNLILLAVMFGTPVAFYFGLRALGINDNWTG